MSIRFKFTFLLFCFAAIAVAFFYHTYKTSEQALEERIGQGLERQAVSMIHKLDLMLYERYQEIDVWAANEVMVDVLRDDKEKRISKYLKKLKRETKFYADFIYADNLGKIIAASNPDFIGVNVYEESWFQNTLENQQTSISGLEQSKVTGSYVATFSAPAKTNVLLEKSQLRYSEGKEDQNLLETLRVWKPESLGIFAGYLDWDIVISMINSEPVLDQETQTEAAYAMLVDSTGLAITQPYFEKNPVMFFEKFNPEKTESVRKAIAGESGFSIEKDFYKNQALIGYAASKGYRDFPGFGWSLLVFQNSSVALSAIGDLRIQIVGIGILFVLLIGFIWFFVSQTITKRLAKLVDLTQTIAKGDLSKEIRVKGRDEIGKLAGSFSEMTAGLEAATADIRKAHDYTDNIIRSTVDAMLVTDDRGVIKSCNPAVTEILSYKEEDLKGESILNLALGEKPFGSIWDNDVARAVKSKNILNKEVNFRAKGGKEIPMLVSAKLMETQGDEFAGIVFVAKDMSEFKSLEEQFHRAQRMDAVGRLAGGIAHDFNNMLTVINGHSELMLRKMGEEDPRGGSFGQILKAGKRAASLVRQLLTFSRRQIVKPTTIDFNELVESMVKMLRHMLGENVEVSTELSSELWPTKVDSGQFEQVLANLAVNARDAMPKGGKFIIKTENMSVSSTYAAEHPGMKPGEYVLVSCMDTGTGMTKEVQERIFEPFFTTKGKDKGTGLGLATCYGMVKQAGGYTDVESSVGVGTIFKLFIPRSHEEVKSLNESEAFNELPRGDETILLTEDETLVRDLAKEILSEQGYSVLEAENGVEALKLIKEKPDFKIDLLITDVMMPKMGGRELVEQLKTSLPHLKVIFMSGYVDDDFVHKNAMDDSIIFLPKPVTPTALALKVRDVLDGKTQVNEE